MAKASSTLGSPNLGQRLSSAFPALRALPPKLFERLAAADLRSAPRGTTLVNVAGGMRAWKEAGLPTVARVAGVARVARVAGATTAETRT